MDKFLPLTLSICLVSSAPSEAGTPKVFEASSTTNIAAIAGRWQALSVSNNALDPKLVSAGRVGFSISIDDKLGHSHKKHFEHYARFLKEHGHHPLASGVVKFDWGGEATHVVTSKQGSLYLWYGPVFGGNLRIFLGRGSNASSVDLLTIEWAEWCGHSRIDADREWATIVYKRDSDSRR